MSWVDCKEEKIHEEVHATLCEIEKVQKGDIDGSLFNYRMYSNAEFSGFDYSTYKARTSTNSLKFNIVKSVIDTLCSKISKNRPKIRFLTSGAEPSLQKKSKLLEKFIAGQFYQQQLYRKAPQAFRDALIDGTGFIKFYIEDNEIQSERVLPVEIYFDDKEAMYGKPQSIYQKRWVSADLLIASFPEHEAKILTAARDSRSKKNWAFKPSAADSSMVLVIESWALKNKKRPGKRAITISNCTLEVEDYNKSHFPFAVYRWSDAPVGYRGTGVVKEIKGLQIEINKTLDNIQKINKNMAIPRIFLEKQSEINVDEFTDEVASFIEYSGVAPTIHSGVSAPNGLVEYLRDLIRNCYEISGVSMLSARSQKPAGLDSGAALREFNDKESERFVLASQQYEEFYLDCSEIIIDLAKEIASKGEKLKVNVQDKNFLEEIKWEDISINEDQYSMRLYPASSLSDDPAGRRQDIQDLIGMGAIDRDTALELLQIPDLDGHLNIQNASREDIKRTGEKMLETGKFSTPEPFQNLEYGISYFNSLYLSYKWRDIPAERLELLRRWQKEATVRLERATEKEIALQRQMNPAPVEGDIIRSKNREINSF